MSRPAQNTSFVRKISPLAARSALALAAVATIAPAAMAVNGGAAATANFKYVGRIQDQNTTAGSHYGTGSYIRLGVVLTAGHCVNDNLNGVTEPVYERFELGGTQYFGLGVQNPGYSPGPLSNFDDGLILLLNGPAAPMGGFGVLAGAADVVPGGASVEVVGFTGSAISGNPLLGTMKETSTTANLINYGPNPNLTEGGDSGGPQIYDFGVAGGGKKIVSTTRSGNTTTITTGVRVDVNRPFIDGNGDGLGAGGTRVLNYLSGTSSGFFDLRTWSRGSAGANSAPGVISNSDVVILDPTTGSDVTTFIQTNFNVTMDGLLNDVKLAARSTVSVAGSTGALNGGQLLVDDVLGVLNIAHAIDNEGLVELSLGGSMAVGASLPASPAPPNNFAFLDAVLNGKNATFTVKAESSLNVANANIFATFNNSKTATFNIQGTALAAGTATLDALDNTGTVNVTSRGNLVLRAITFNNEDGVINVSGGILGNGTIGGGSMLNAGQLNVNSGGVVDVIRPAIQIGGIALQLTATGKVTVNNGGTLNVTAGGNVPVGNALTAVGDSVIVVNAGGVANIKGKSLVNGGLDINGGAAAGGLVTIAPSPAIPHGELFLGGDGLLDFGLLAANRGVLSMDNADLISTGQYRGKGIIKFENDANFDNKTVGALSAVLRMNGIHVVFDGAAKPAAGYVTMETTADDAGADLAPFIVDKFALEELCIIDASLVKLVDNNVNEAGGGEVIYTKWLGVSFDSTLDLNGLTVYYQSIDWDCGGLAGTILENGGELIQVPEPMSGMLLLGLVIPLMRRRRSALS